MFSSLIFVLDGKYDPNLESILHEYGKQDFDLESRHLIFRDSYSGKCESDQKILLSTLSRETWKSGSSSPEKCF